MTTRQWRPSSRFFVQSATGTLAAHASLVVAPTPTKIQPQLQLQFFHAPHCRYLLNCHELYESPQCIWVVMEVYALPRSASATTQDLIFTPYMCTSHLILFCVYLCANQLIQGGELLDTLIETGVYDEAHASRAIKQVGSQVRLNLSARTVT